MNVNGSPCRSLRLAAGGVGVEIIDQTRLPHVLHWIRLDTLEDAAHAIRTMQVRGAPLIGATAAYGVALAMDEDNSDAQLARATALLAATRPTAVNLHWALSRMQAILKPLAGSARVNAAWMAASQIAEADVSTNAAIGAHGLALLRPLFQRLRGTGHDTLHLMTHCNAGWLATVDWGTALAPVYAAHAAGLPVHVWVSETRPRNQGLLTAWELAQAGIPHTVMADNAAGLLMARGQVDAVIVGADRIAANGDVANKVGTYLKALAAAAHGIPFYVAAPCSTLDFASPNGAAIPIETRDAEEVRLLHGLRPENGCLASLRQLPESEAAYNPAFDVTPASLVSRIITEHGDHAPGSLSALRPKKG